VKWLFLALLLGAIIPATIWIRLNKKRVHYLWIVVGLFPFLVGPFHLVTAPISWPTWLGYVKGLEITVLDAFAVAFCLGSPRLRSRLPFKLALTFYMVAVVLSSFRSRIPTASVFYIWQIARMFLLYAAVARGTQSLRMPYALLSGMTLGMSYEAVLAASSRLAGVVQPGGTFGHQNSLGMSTYFVLYPSFALLLAGRKGWQPVVGVFTALIVVVLTASRATMGFAAIGLLLILMLSIKRGLTARKITLALCGVLGLLVIVPAATMSLEGRFGKAAVFKTDGERNALEASASAILSDYPLGIGPNMFALVSTTDGYSRAAGLTWRSTGSLVHNAYWLVAVETGYLGLVAYVLLLASPICYSWPYLSRRYRDLRADMLAGYWVCLVVLYLHSLYEFVLLQWVLQSLLFMAFGLVFGLSIQMRVVRRYGAIKKPGRGPFFTYNDPEEPSASVHLV